MARFIDTSNDKEIVDFNKMTWKQFRYLVKEAQRINEEEKYEIENETINKYYDNFPNFS